MRSRWKEIMAKLEKLPWKPKRIPTYDEQIGWWVGDHIFHTKLPTLSIYSDGPCSRKIIKATDEEEAEYKRLHNIWCEKVWNLKKKDKHLANKEWNTRMAFMKEMEEKYMPPILKCYLSKIYVNNVDNFKKGLASSLWNCDCCNYSTKLDDIVITEDQFFTIITLKLDTNKIIQPE